MTAQLKAMVLDLDGVITSTAETHALAWKTMFDHYLQSRAVAGDEPFRPFDAQSDYLAYVDGKPRYDGVRSFLASRGISLPVGSSDDPGSEETVCGLGSRKNAEFLRLLAEQGVSAFPDARDCTRRWRAQGKRLAVVSSSRNCTQILEAGSARHWFDAQVDGSDLIEGGLRGKPAPDMFLRAADLLDVSPTETAVFEDAVAGVQAGSAGGFRVVVGVARHGRAQMLLDNGADVVVSSLDETERALAAAMR